MARKQTRVPHTRVPYPPDMVPGSLSEPRAVTGRVASLDAPAFVKLAYALIGCVALIYFLIRMRQGSSLVAAAEVASAGLVFAIGALVVVFGVLVVGSSLRLPSRDR